MTLALLIVGYALGMLVVACRIATVLAWRSARRSASYYYGDHDYSPTDNQWAVAIIDGFGAAILWPLVVMAWLGRRVLFAPPVVERERIQKRRIAALELELELSTTAKDAN